MFHSNIKSIKHLGGHKKRSCFRWGNVHNCPTIDSLVVYRDIDSISNRTQSCTYFTTKHVCFCVLFLSHRMTYLVACCELKYELFIGWKGLISICHYSTVRRWWLASSPAAVTAIWRSFRWSIWTPRRAPRATDWCRALKAHQRLTSLFIDALFHFEPFHPSMPSECVRFVQFVL